MIPNIGTEAFGYRGFHTCDKMYLSQLNEAGIITMIPFGSYKLRIRESQWLAQVTEAGSRQYTAKIWTWVAWLSVQCYFPTPHHLL